jgi:hypothetical protein
MQKSGSDLRVRTGGVGVTESFEIFFAKWSPPPHADLRFRAYVADQIFEHCLHPYAGCAGATALNKNVRFW